jgi:hypothetical protein
MENLLGALVMTTGAFAALPALAQESACVAPTDRARIESEDPARSTIRLEWRAPSEGATVRVQLSEDPEFGRALVDREVPCCEVTLRGLDVGQYHWRVLGADSDAEHCRASFEVVALPKQE